MLVGGPWHHRTLESAPPAAGNPTAISWDGSDILLIVYRGADGHVHALEFRFDPQVEDDSRRDPYREVRNWTWNHHDLTASLNLPLAAHSPTAFPAKGILGVAYADPDGQIVLVWLRRV